MVASCKLPLGIPSLSLLATAHLRADGNRLRVISAATDCDNDALLFRVEVEGDGLVCHEGTVSCFTKPIAIAAEVSRG